MRRCLAILTRPDAPFPTHSPSIHGPIALGSVGRSKAAAPPAASFSLAHLVPKGASYLMGGGRGGLSDSDMFCILAMRNSMN